MSFGLLKIENNAAFVTIEMQEVRTHAGVAVGRDVTRVVTFRRLYFDNVSAVIG